jgi:uncharacterized membrane protein
MSRLRRYSVAATSLLVISLLAVETLQAQEQIVTDRPDFTESTASVDPGRVQLETGVTLTEAGETDSTSFGEVLVRIGWTQALELRLGLNSWVNSDGPGGSHSDLEDSWVGIKLELKQPAEGAAKAVPQLALLLGTTLPTGTTESSPSGLQPGATLALAWTLSETLGLGVNFGAASAISDDERFLEGAASIALGIALGGDWGAFVEYYGFLPEGSAGDVSHFGNGGLTYLISDNFQLDLRAGTALSGDDTDFFAGFGLGYRW